MASTAKGRIASSAGISGVIGDEIAIHFSLPVALCREMIGALIVLPDAVPAARRSKVNSVGT